MPARLLIFAYLFATCFTAGAASLQRDSVPTIVYKVVAEFPHDTTAFTEGFLFHNGQLFESTGSPDDMPEARSYFGIVDIATGKIDKKAELESDKYFGEGITFLNGKVFQLTYTNQICFVYDEKLYTKIAEHKFNNKEGWGLTTDGKSLVMSDGTSELTYVEPDNFKMTKRLRVTEDKTPVTDLNELEYINGFIYANVWFTDNIVKIDPATGKVIAKLNLTAVREKEKLKNPHLDLLNGIAFNPLDDKILITGKLWSTIYQLEFSH